MSRKTRDQRRIRDSKWSCAQECAEVRRDINTNPAQGTVYGSHSFADGYSGAGIERRAAGGAEIYATAIGPDSNSPISTIMGTLVCWALVILVSFVLLGCANRLPLPTEAKTANEAADIMLAWSSSLSAGVSAWHDLCIESDRTEEHCDAEALVGLGISEDLIEAADSVETLEDIDGELLSRAKLLRRAVAPWIPAGADLSYLDVVGPEEGRHSPEPVIVGPLQDI